MAHADEDDRADPGRHQARQQDQRQDRPAEAGGLNEDDRADDRRAEDRGDRGERRARGEHRHRLVGSVFFHQPHGQDRQAAAEGDERGFWSQHQAQAQGGQRGQQDARQLGRLGGAGLDPLVGDVPAVAGQAHDRDGRQHPGHRQHRQRPPPGNGMKPQIAGQALVHLVLDPVDQFQEAPRGERDQHADQRGQDEQDAVALAPDVAPGSAGAAAALTHRRHLLSPAHPPWPSSPTGSRDRPGRNSARDSSGATARASLPRATRSAPLRCSTAAAAPHPARRAHQTCGLRCRPSSLSWPTSPRRGGAIPLAGTHHGSFRWRWYQPSTTRTCWHHARRVNLPPPRRQLALTFSSRLRGSAHDRSARPGTAAGKTAAAHCRGSAARLC